MARVLKRASENPKLWRGKYTCTGKGWVQNTHPCGSLIEVLASDITTRDHTDYGGGRDTYYGFYCPVCGCFTEIPESKLPYEVKSMAQSTMHYM